MLRLAGGLMVVTAVTFGSSVAVVAEAPFSGTDAAMIDWAVKNCGMKSTAAEHALVDAANARGRDGFNRQYMQQFRAPAFAAAADDRSRRVNLCRDIKEWYGPEGTRFSKLLVGEGDATLAPATSPAQSAIKAPDVVSPKGGHGRH